MQGKRELSAGALRKQSPGASAKGALSPTHNPPKAAAAIKTPSRWRMPRCLMCLALAAAVSWCLGVMMLSMKDREASALGTRRIQPRAPAVMSNTSTSRPLASARPSVANASVAHAEVERCAALGECARCKASDASPSVADSVCVWCRALKQCVPYTKRTGDFPCVDAVRAGPGYPGGSSCAPLLGRAPGTGERRRSARGAAVFSPRAADLLVEAAVRFASRAGSERGSTIDAPAATARPAAGVGALVERVPPIWLERPGRALEDSLLVGTGRLGGSAAGGVLRAALLINEESLWNGSPLPLAPAPADGAGPAAELVRRVDAALRAGNASAAEASAAKLVRGGQASYEYAGRLKFQFILRDANGTEAAVAGAAVDVRGYRRQLALGVGLVSESFEHAGCVHTRELFGSAADDVLVMRLRADAAAAPATAVAPVAPRDAGAEAARCACCVEVALSLERPEAKPPPVGVAASTGGCGRAHDGGGGGTHELRLSAGSPGPALAYAVVARALVERAEHARAAADGVAPNAAAASGCARAEGNKLTVRGARELLLVVDSATSRDGAVAATAAARAGIQAALDQLPPGADPWNALLARHASARAPAAERASLLLGPLAGGGGGGGGARGTAAAEGAADLSTPARLARLRARALRLGGLGGGGVADGAAADVDGAAADESILLSQAFALGRHLLLGSAAGARVALPPTLQGVWCEGLRPPWHSDFHLNINLQMIYWLAGPARLEETARPLARFVGGLAAQGARTAVELYGCDSRCAAAAGCDAAGEDAGAPAAGAPAAGAPAAGAPAAGAPAAGAPWVAHGFTDAWHNTAPLGETVWSLCASCGGWIALALADAHAFTRDEGALRESYPHLAGAARGLVCRLGCGGAERGAAALGARAAALAARAAEPDALDAAPLAPCGLGPSTSPENSFASGAALDGGRARHVSLATAFDRAVADALFEATAAAEATLGGGPLGRVLDAARAALASGGGLVRAAADGRGLAEWLAPEPARGAAELDPGHRHWSHLWVVYPGGQLSARATPRGPDEPADAADALLAAAARSVDARVAAGGAHTGWSGAWLALLRARLADGSGGARALRHVLGQFASPALLGLHPPMKPTARARAAKCGGCVERSGGAGDGVFQMDANAGVAAALAELVLQSHSRECALHLLPALPPAAREAAWRDGVASGLGARGGLNVSLSWAAGELRRAVVQRWAGAGGPVRVCLADGRRLRAERDGRPWPVAYEAPANLVEIPAGAAIVFRPVDESARAAG